MGSFLSIVTAADLSGIIGGHLYKRFRAASSVITTANLAGIVWSSIRDLLGQMFGVASTLSLLDQTPRYHEAAYGTHLNFFSGSSCTILTPVGPQASFGSPLWFT